MSATSSSQQNDIQELIRAIHEDRVAAKDKEKRDGWTKYVSLMIVGLAVATAIGALKAGGFGSKVMLKQAQASDTWAFYQAKSIKQRIAEMEARNATGDVQTKMLADVERYKKEEGELKDKADGLEKERDENAKHGPPLGFAIACLQISIALSSICLITKKKPLWGASGVLGLVGAGYLIYGLYLV
jgi:hypothetical protein